MRGWLVANAANGAPIPGDPNESLQDFLAQLDPRGELPDLPPEFNEITTETPLTVEEWDDPAIMDRAAEVEAWREEERRRNNPRVIPGLVREE